MIFDSSIIEYIKEKYIINKRSCREIKALIFKKYKIKVCSEIIRRILIKNNIKIRDVKEAITTFHRNKEPIKEIITLYKENISIREISRKLKINRLTIKKILKENNLTVRQSRESLIAMGHIKEKKKFNLSLKEMAYLFGLVMGDLTPVKKSNYTLKLITHTTHKTFAELLLNSFKIYGPTNYKLNKYGEFRFQSHLDLESFNFLLDSKNNRIPSWITNENFFDFLAGFIDSDGSILIKKAGKYFQFCIRFFGENIIILNQIKSRLENFGYYISMHKNHSKGDFSLYQGKKIHYNRDYFAIELQSKMIVLDLLNKIPIRHPEKKARRDLIYEVNKMEKFLWKDIENRVKELRNLIERTVKTKTILKY